MDDVNDMDKSTDTVEQWLGSLGRRDFLTKAAVAGALAWTAPMILSRPAHAAAAGGTPKCRPTIGLECETVPCNAGPGGGQKHFPGFRANIGPCGCPPNNQVPVTCIIITNITSDCGAVVTYGGGTLCKPNPPTDDIILSTGTWQCLDPTEPFFFGQPRSGGGQGAIPEIPNDCMISFKVGVWAGQCPDSDSPDDAFTCQTFDVSFTWDQQQEKADPCTITPDPANTHCAGVGEHPPCCPPGDPDCCP